MKKGFTLAEVLITLGVIGVVAALTIPGAMESHQKKVWVTQLQKVYNQITDATARYAQEKDSLFLNGDEGFDLNKFFSYLPVADGCEKPSSCLAESYKSLDGKKTYGTDTDITGKIDSKTKDQDGNWQITYKENDFITTCVSLNTGAVVCMVPMGADIPADPDPVDGWNYSHGFSSIIVDVNGKAGPNIKSRDYFYFELYSDGKIGLAYDPVAASSSEKATSYGYKSLAEKCLKWVGGSYGENCLAKIISDGWKMDY